MPLEGFDVPGKTVQISAPVAAETKAALDEYVERSGMKKGRVIEDALLHYLHALRELPADVITPPRLTLTRQSFDRVVERITNPPEPTEALRELVNRED